MEQDLFEKWETLPANVLAIIEHMNEQQEKGKWGYEDCKHYRKELEAIGYTYDFGLDGEPYDLRKTKGRPQDTRGRELLT